MFATVTLQQQVDKQRLDERKAHVKVTSTRCDRPEAAWGYR